MLDYASLPPTPGADLSALNAGVSDSDYDSDEIVVVRACKNTFDLNMLNHYSLSQNSTKYGGFFVAEEHEALF